MEYVGEVLDYRAFKCRTRRYARENHEHHYFMALSADEVIDAAKKGNVSRFINHCCDPNAETQKVCPLYTQLHCYFQHFGAQCCCTGTTIKCPVPDQVKLSFVIFDIWSL